MTYELNETHDPSLECRVLSAHDSGTDFPIQNLPFGVFCPEGSQAPAHTGVAIGNSILDLVECRRRGLLDGLPAELIEASTGESLNALMALGPEHWSSLRKRVSRILRKKTGPSHGSEQIDFALVPMNAVRMLLPVRIGDYTDFYASIHHARNVGSMFRPDNPLLPNYRHVPVGYHGRASSIVVSGTHVRRPWGQQEKNSVPFFGPTRMLDYELEIGFFVGQGNILGEPIRISEAESRLFGLCLLNDWSARDMQKWEYQPLGPFLAKSFATSISPWIVTLEALVPYRVPGPARASDDPAPLPYLAGGIENAGVDLSLEVFLVTEQMIRSEIEPVRLSRGNLSTLYWSPGQLLTHHASNGCNLRPGDLIASGTISGEEKSSRGCLIELSWRGSEPVALPGGETRAFLEDGDQVILRGRAERTGYVPIGFGECRGTVMAAVQAK